MKNIVVFGAGKSSTCLIDYLTRICTENHWTLFIGDANAENLKLKFEKSGVVELIQVNVEETAERNALIKKADLVISLLPPALHILIAKNCLTESKNLLTASYVDEEIRKLESEISRKKLFFLCEMGLDPGIDHMSAMQIIHKIKSAGGNILLFRSHTGGLVAPESDDNPWHYKISWNPANVVKAGAAGAIFKREDEIVRIEYSDLFEHTGQVEIKPLGIYDYYPNRDSLSYIPVYGLESAHTFIRTTLRHPEFCQAWKNLVKAGLTDDTRPVASSLKTYAEWSEPLSKYIDPNNRNRYDQLGLLDQLPLPAGTYTSAKLLQGLLEKNWKMKETDKDMILMLHEFAYEMNNESYFLNSRLVVKGENARRTAMAKTVGLPLGIAAKLILENKISLHGLHIPIISEIYEPVLQTLEEEGICFHEEVN